MKKKASEIKIGDIIIERYRVTGIADEKELKEKYGKRPGMEPNYYDGKIALGGPIINMANENMADLAWTVDSETEFEVEE